MRFKRIVSMCLVALLIVSAGSVAFADSWKTKGGNKMPPGLAKKGGLPPGIAKKVFNDIDNYDWALQAIESLQLKGLIKGVDKTKSLFAPKDAVTKIESIIMALRVMGWEDDALDIRALPKDYKGKKVDQWAKGYITLARKKGILDDVDLLYFDPKAPVKRHEIAKYIIRALGFEDEAQDYMDEDLPFIDESAVPKGSIGYVYLIDKMGIMTGNNKDAFNPMGSLTRVEMAVVFWRVDKKVDSDVDEREVVGTVYKIKDDVITIDHDNERKAYRLADYIIVYDEDNKRTDSRDVDEGDRVKLTLQNNRVVYIAIVRDEEEEKILSRFTGDVIRINDGSKKTLAIEIKEMVVIFEAIDDVDVEFENGAGNFEEIKENDRVTILVDRNNRARHIDVHRDYERDIETEQGEITNLDLAGTYHIEIDHTNYLLSEDADVEIDNRDKDLEDLELGMEAEVKLENDKVIEIEAESIDEEDVQGEITGLDLAGTYHIEIDHTNYLLSEDADVEIDNRDRDLDDLEEGMEVEVKLENDVVVEVEAESINFDELYGRITALDLEGRYHITINDEEYSLSEDAYVEIEDDEEDLDNLMLGMEVKVTIEDDQVVDIEVDDVNIRDIEGEITDIDLVGTYHIEIDDTRYLLLEDARVEGDDDNLDLSDLREGLEGDFEIVNDMVINIEIEEN